ncbi:type II toxin-antitoxin system RelB/DinJ family antitoxin [Endozoicomonas ascidiicola]|uniref:type II toxin-antitoxin system RelB/DinJ family antitoxin n=1 Tax=Endozoicomonas ascidiicola TaxID=1698521 RepID=UPI00082CF577|nr:type II toxin-antitoxin system RelB/DinJ family antitoxin [Endozoicomonas ascidiicola]
MAKETTVRARIDEALKEQAEDILRKLGLTTSQAINLYFSQIVLQRGMPFEVRLPEEIDTD